MSLKTWKEEFYPIEADKCKKKDAIKHSLQKWIGLRQSNLRKHKIFYDFTESTMCNLSNEIDHEYFYPVNHQSCSLCQIYLNNRSYTNSDDCVKCPLAITRNGLPCTFGFNNHKSPYNKFRTKGDPEPMISLIRKAIKQKGITNE